MRIEDEAEQIVDDKLRCEILLAFEKRGIINDAEYPDPLEAMELHTAINSLLRLATPEMENHPTCELVVDEGGQLRLTTINLGDMPQD